MESSKPLDYKLEIGLWRADLTTPSLLATLGMESSSGKSLRKFLSTSMPASAVNNLSSGPVNTDVGQAISSLPLAFEVQQG